MSANKTLRSIGCLIAFLCIAPLLTCAQEPSLKTFADSIRKAYHIPELAYAVISSDSVYDIQVIGVKKVNTSIPAEITDRFRIGSNTKAITGFIAAVLVKEGKLSWDSRFFDLFPELKAASDSAYHNLTLLDLLSFRSKLYPYTYTYDEPHKEQFTGSEEQQRYQFAAWFFKTKPLKADNKDSIRFSNLNYIAAGLMMQKVTGKPYKQLVKELGEEQGISFDFGQPNSHDTMQPWGHDANLNPEPPGDSYKLNWLLPAGNINVSLAGYIKFIQLQLKGLQGRSALLSPAEFNFLFYGRSRFSIGWFWDKDADGNICAHNEGNPGTFLSQVFVYKQQNKAYILFSNAQTDDAEEGLSILFNELKQRYNQ